MYPVGQRGPDPTGAGDPNQGYRPHDAEGDADAEGERAGFRRHHNSPSLGDETSILSEVGKMEL